MILTFLCASRLSLVFTIRLMLWRTLGEGTPSLHMPRLPEDYGSHHSPVYACALVEILALVF